MTVVRQDGWSLDEDTLLAEVILRYIREGNTQLRAFEEVGVQLSRTAAACGFRWNSYVRKQYADAIELAKRSRRTNQSALREKIVLPEVSESEVAITEQAEMSLEKCIQFLTELKLKVKSIPSKKMQDLVKENDYLQTRLKLVETEKNKLKQSLNEVSDDYQSLLRVFEKARKLVVKEADGPKTKFQMDQNGNLERV